jgi:UDP-N-acetylmuramoylalanine-D-glutamate ligase
MSIEQLTIANTHTSLAARAYQSVLFRRQEIFKMFDTQEGRPFRKELVATIEGVRYINDAFALNPNMTWFTMEEIPSRIVWVACQNEWQKCDYAALREIVRQKVIAIVAFGSAAQEIKQYFDKEISTLIVANDCAGAVEFAHAIAHKDDVVLFSPANGIKEDIDIRGKEFSANVLAL